MRPLIFSLLFTFITDVLTEVNADCGGTIDALQQRTGSIRYRTRINHGPPPFTCTWTVDARVSQTVRIEVLDVDGDAQVRVRSGNDSFILKDRGEEDGCAWFSSTGRTAVEWSWEDGGGRPRDLHLNFNTSSGGSDPPHAPYTRSDSDPVSPSPGGAAGVTRVPDVSGFGGQGGGEPGPADKDGSSLPQEAAHNGQERSGAVISELVGLLSRVGLEIPSSEQDPAGPTAGARVTRPKSPPATEKIDPRILKRAEKRSTVGPTSQSRASGNKGEEARPGRSSPSTQTMPSASTANEGRDQPSGTASLKKLHLASLHPASHEQGSETKGRRANPSHRATHAPRDAPPQTLDVTTTPCKFAAGGPSSRPDPGTLGTPFTPRGLERSSHQATDAVSLREHQTAFLGGAMTTGVLGTAPEGQSSETERRRADRSHLKNVLSLGDSDTVDGGAATMPPTSTVHGASGRPGSGARATTPEVQRSLEKERSPRSVSPQTHDGTMTTASASAPASGWKDRLHRTSLSSQNPKPRSNQAVFRNVTTPVSLSSAQALSPTIEDLNAVSAGEASSGAASTTHVPTVADARSETDGDGTHSSPRSTPPNRGASLRPARTRAPPHREVLNQTPASVWEGSDPVSGSSPAPSRDQTDMSAWTNHVPTRSVEDLKQSTAPTRKEVGYTTDRPSFTNTFDLTPHVSPSSAYLATWSPRSPNTDGASATTLTVSTVTSGSTPTAESPHDPTLIPTGSTGTSESAVPLSDSRLTTPLPPQTASATPGTDPRRSRTSGPDLSTPSPPDARSTPVLNTADGATPTRPSSENPETPSQDSRVPSEPPSGTGEASHSSQPGTQTLMPVTKRPLIHAGTARGDRDWAGDARVFVLEDQPAVVSVETFQVLLQVILDGTSPSPGGLVEIEPFLRRIAGYQSQQVTWRSGPAFQSVVTFRTAEAVSWLGGAESLLQWAGLRPLPAGGIFVDGVRVKNITVGGLDGDVCSRLFSCPLGFQCVSSEGNASCRSVCHSGYCKHQGICVHRPGRLPVCQCPVGEDFWFMGQRCDLRMTRQRLAGACFGALVAVATLMAILAYLAVRRFKSMLAQARAEQTRSRFNHFDELSARFWRRSDDSLENAAFTRSDQLLGRPCCYHDDTLSLASTDPGSAAHVRTVYPRSWQYRWDVSTCSLADGVVDSGKASDLSVCSWPIEPIQWTPFPLLQQLDNTTAVKCSRSRSYCEGMELVDMEKSRTA